jgi:hypothetical protein
MAACCNPAKVRDAFLPHFPEFFSELWDFKKPKVL